MYEIEEKLRMESNIRFKRGIYKIYGPSGHNMSLFIYCLTCLALQFDYTKIEADGESSDYISGVYAGTIYQETKSEQIFYSLNIGCSF